MVCKLCEHEIDELSHDIKHFVVDFIKQEHPEWLESDGACPKCLEYYENLDKVVEVIPPKN